MPSHAGFAAAIAIGQNVFQDALRILHAADKLSHTLNAPIPIPPTFGGGLISLNFFLDVPTLTCSDGTADRFILDLAAWGPMTVTQPGGGSIDRIGKIEVRILVTPILTLLPATQQLMLQLDAANAEVPTVAFEVAADATIDQLLPPQVQQFVDSDDFAKLIKLGGQATLGSVAQSIPPFDVKFLGSFTKEPSARIGGTRVRNGSIVLGMDAEVTVQLAGGPPISIKTAGNGADLVDFRDGEDVATYVNAAMAPVMFGDVAVTVDKAVTDKGAHLDDLQLVLEEGHLHIAGSASNDTGSQSFSMNAVPRFRTIQYIVHTEPKGYEEFYEGWYREAVEVVTEPEQLMFSIEDIQVDTDPVWWARLLEIVFPFIAISIVEHLASLKTAETYDTIGGSGGGGRAVRNQSYAIAGTTSPMIALRLDRFDCHSDGVFIGVSFSAGLGPWPPIPEKSTTAEAVNIDDLQWRKPFARSYVVPLVRAHPDDPLVRVRWTFRRLDRNEVVQQVDGPLPSNKEFTVDFSASDLVLSPSFNVEMRVYRRFGAEVTELADSLVTIAVTDRLDRSHPYVHWQHMVSVPVVTVGPHGERTKLRQDLITRRSRIHRTHVPGRCRMVSRFAGELSGKADDDGSSHVDYLDALPFPVSDITAHRGEVCDFCFFDGPAGKAPVPLP